jgi:hypothetical protein
MRASCLARLFLVMPRPLLSEELPCKESATKARQAADRNTRKNLRPVHQCFHYDVKGLFPAKINIDSVVAEPVGLFLGF